MKPLEEKSFLQTYGGKVSANMGEGNHSTETPSLGRGLPALWNPRGSELKNAQHREGQVDRG